MNPRMNNPAAVIPDAMPAILNLFKTTKQGGGPDATMQLVQAMALTSDATAVNGEIVDER